MSEVYHNTNELQPSSSIMDQNDPWSAYDAVVEEEEREFYKGGYPVLLNPKTGTCFVPKRDYDRNLKDEKWRTIKAAWIVKQFGEEKTDTYHFEHEEWWDSVSRKYRHNGIRYRSFPQENGVIVAVSKIGKFDLPTHEDERVELVESWLEGMPDGKQIGGQRDFGGEFRGLKPRGDGKYIRIKSHIRRVERLAIEDNMLVWSGEDVIELQKEKAEEWVKGKFSGNIR